MRAFALIRVEKDAKNMEYIWEIIHECDDEVTGEPSNWAAEVNSERYGKFVWISHNANGQYDVEVRPHGEFKVLVSCKSLASAKRWVAMNI